LAGATAGLVVLLQACLSSRPPPAPAPAASRLSSPEALAPFFAKLATLDDKTAPQPVRVLQIGDSHTANDSLSGRLREQLQGRFGAAGRGWLPAGIPFKYYRPQLVSVSESGWEHLKLKDHGDAALGLDAVAAQSTARDAVMALQSTDPVGFDRFAVEYLTQPNGAAFTVAVDDDAPIRVSTAAVTAAIKLFDLPLDRPAHRIELRAEGRPPPVLLGWTAERRTAGIIYENHGTIGATVGLLSQITPEAAAFELRERRPALLIVAFGTNEGFDDTLDPDRYAARFEGGVESLRRAAGGAPVMILGPPDGVRAERGCTAAPCGGSDPCARSEPAKLAAVRDIQRRVAAREGWAYWDWFAAMGGICSIDRMSAADPPLAMPDRVHLSSAGYRAIADLLFADLMRAYEEWKALPRTS
jgi:lysophospholipase L1-like esterase